MTIIAIIYDILDHPSASPTPASDDCDDVASLSLSLSTNVVVAPSSLSPLFTLFTNVVVAFSSQYQWSAMQSTTWRYKKKQDILKRLIVHMSMDEILFLYNNCFSCSSSAMASTIKFWNVYRGVMLDSYDTGSQVVDNEALAAATWSHIYQPKQSIWSGLMQEETTSWIWNASS
ncbi:uncharacterized protein BX664DRAFT_346395 [Halteromyces radiatus]|uniref:uncharacterized protein n=1 Tax=Halteromyces radiatus TaxID=101107 RepID=UPI00221E7358|nr:uncharacterized protein BX664DRAFT_346395 [Halteromyces radiatus]KAI8096329.1 hypothetical protein BX664DRAFT_346395 [Halteromyces radiatus]